MGTLWNVDSSGNLTKAVHEAIGVNATLNTFAGVTHNIISTIEEHPTSFANNTAGQGVYLELDPGATITTDTYAARNRIEIKSGNSQDITGRIKACEFVIMHKGTGDCSVEPEVGVSGQVTNAGSGSMQYAVGSVYEVQNTSTGTITIAAGVMTQMANANASGTITSAMGVWVTKPTNAGTLTNLYGLYVEDLTGIGSTKSYNIFSEGASSKVLLEGNLINQGHSAFGANATLNSVASTTTNTGIVFEENLTQVVNPNTGMAIVVHLDTTANNALTHIGQDVNLLVTGTEAYSGIVCGQKVYTNYNSSGTNSGFIFGQWLLTEDGTNNPTTAIMGGQYFQMNRYSSSTVGTYAGMVFDVQNQTGAGAVTEMWGMNLSMKNRANSNITTVRFITAQGFRNAGTGTVGEATDLLLQKPVNDGGGSITNVYGLYIEDMSGIGTSISRNMHSVGTNSINIFEGKLGIGSVTTPTSSIDTSGDIETADGGAMYFGDPTTNNTWKIVRSGNDLIIQRRESGSYVTKTTILA